MKYRSSITKFVKALLTDAATLRDEEIDRLERVMQEEGREFRDVLLETLASERRTCLRKAQEAIPAEDWEEIIDYICRHYCAYGHTAVAPNAVRTPVLLLPWLASIAVCGLDDIGR